MSEYKLVPVEPTEEMIEAGDRIAEIHNEYGENLYIKNTDEVYKAMLSASPTTDTINVDRAEYEAMKADADCFKFWVSEAARNPINMAKLIANCTTEQEYRDAIMPCINFANQAIDQARKV